LNGEATTDRHCAINCTVAVNIAKSESGCNIGPRSAEALSHGANFSDLRHMAKQGQNIEANTAVVSAAKGRLAIGPKLSPGSAAPIAWPSLPTLVESHGSEQSAAAILEPMRSVRAAATHLGVHEETVRREIDRGRLKASKVGGQWRISRAALDEYLLATSSTLKLY
jgi:excisionase family DNA binding protein